MTIEWLEQFADGLSAACQQLSPDCGVVGGDLASSEQVFIAVTAHGSLEGREPVLRTSAKVGDIVAVGGTLGQAAAGLALLNSQNVDAISAYDHLVNVQLRPQPPMALGVEASVAGATSMLDISDGLAKDATRIADASGVTIALESLNLQGFEAVIEQAAQAIEASAKDWVLFGGEDHSLLATFDPQASIPRGFKPIGEVAAREAHPLMIDGKPLAAGGWDSVNAE
jgi:thiamine-monophosphate kinase